jgi:polyhydroxyalkanoate synthesis regulator phasin
MLEFFKKGVLAGLRAVVITSDKVREATRALVEEGKLSTDEAEKLAEELVKSGERQWEDFNGKFQTSMRKLSDNLEVVRKKDFQDLKARVELLEQRLHLLEETHRKEGEIT